MSTALSPAAAVLLALALAAPAPAKARAPASEAVTPRAAAFDLLPLGTYGGGYEGNLTSYALRVVGAPEYQVLVDGGSLAAGIGKHLDGRDPEQGRSAGFPAIERFFLGFQHVFFTHPHLDHMAGWITQSPSLFARDEPADVYGHAHTAAALRDQVFGGGALWGDFVAAGKVRLHALEAAPDGGPGEGVEVAGLRVRPFAIDHTVPAFGYLFETPEGAVYAHLGDTGPTRAGQPALRRLLAEGRLRALALECSFGSETDALALQTGHLTPRLLAEFLRELALPARVGDRSPLSAEDLAAMARQLKDTQVLVHHLKPGDERAIRKEIGALRRQGLPLVIPRQAQRLFF